MQGLTENRNLLLWNVKQAAEALGLSVHTLYSWVSMRRIKFVKMGKRTMFDPEDIRAWINENKTQAERN